jgi:hypothetical protein
MTSLPLVFALMLAAPAPATASTLETTARAHLESVRSGNVVAIVNGALPASTLHWLGGPLDGEYQGAETQAHAWQAFARKQGQQALTVSHIETIASPTGGTVSVHVVFAGAKTIHVEDILAIRDGVIVDEVWQIEPGV